jgi:ribosomal protein S3AE
MLVQQNEEDAYRKIRLRVEDVQGKNCLTNYWVSVGTAFFDSFFVVKHMP